MANDNSMASQIEDWIVTQLQGIQFGLGALFNAEDVAPWEGSEQDTAQQFSREFMESKRNRIARVFFLQDDVENLSADDQRIRGRYLVMIGFRNRRPTRSRRGDAGEPGTNAVRDLMRYALHGLKPGVTDGTSFTDKTDFRGTQIVVNGDDILLMTATVIVDEVPA